MWYKCVELLTAVEIPEFVRCMAMSICHIFDIQLDTAFCVAAYIFITKIVTGFCYIRVKNQMNSVRSYSANWWLVTDWSVIRPAALWVKKVD